MLVSPFDKLNSIELRAFEMSDVPLVLYRTKSIWDVPLVESHVSLSL